MIPSAICTHTLLLCVDNLVSGVFTVDFCSARNVQIAINKTAYGADRSGWRRLISLCKRRGPCVNQSCRRFECLIVQIRNRRSSTHLQMQCYLFLPGSDVCLLQEATVNLINTTLRAPNTQLKLVWFIPVRFDASQLFVLQSFQLQQHLTAHLLKATSN